MKVRGAKGVEIKAQNSKKHTSSNKNSNGNSNKNQNGNCRRGSSMETQRARRVHMHCGEGTFLFLEFKV